MNDHLPWYFQGMFDGKRVSVVFSTYQEKNSVRKFVDECFETKLVDEVVVVNNNAEPGTDEELRKTQAIVFHEEKQGYGFGYRRGLEEATGDLIIMTEADGTFSPRDFEKLLVFSRDFPVVFCSRTATYTILEGANMGLFLKWGNWAVAKGVELLYNATQLSDVGCTNRLVTREVLESIKPHFRAGGSFFGLEMTLLILLSRTPFVEIPVHYFPRVGTSAVTGSFLKAFVLGMQMIFLALRMRFPSRKRRALRDAAKNLKLVAN